VIFIRIYDLQHGTHGVNDRLGMQTFFLCLEMMLFLVSWCFGLEETHFSLVMDCHGCYICSLVTSLDSS
jgi:hypothetical protein